MKNRINCRTVLKTICEIEDVFDLKTIDEGYKKHIQTCEKCSSYLNSIQSTVTYYKKYNQMLTSQEQKGLLKSVCCKIKSEIQ